METQTAPNPTAAIPATPRRDRKRKTTGQQILDEAEKMKKHAEKLREKALTVIAKETKAELAKKGEQTFVRWLKSIHPAERDLQVTPALATMPADDRPAVQAWLDLLAKKS